jgi:hypothetical protein
MRTNLPGARLRLSIRIFEPARAAQKKQTQAMYPPEAIVPNPAIAAYVGIDWADQKHDVILCPQAEPAVLEHQVITHSPESLLDWVGNIQQRFGIKGKILVCLEQSRGALIYHLMG